MYKKEIIHRTISIVILTSLCFMAIVMIAKQSWKIINTAAQLIQINDDISYYNDCPQKTDVMTKGIEKLYQLRQEIYDSSDFVVRTFARAWAPVKVVILILAITIPIALIYLVSIEMWDMYVRRVVTLKRIMRRP